MKRSIRIEAADPKAGLTVGELQDALVNVNPENAVRVIVGFKGQLKAVIVEVGK